MDGRTLGSSARHYQQQLDLDGRLKICSMLALIRMKEAFMNSFVRMRLAVWCSHL